MSLVRAVDDFEKIRLRLEELRRERAQLGANGSLPESCSSAPEVRRPPQDVADIRTPLAPRRQLRTRFWNVRYPHARME